MPKSNLQNKMFRNVIFLGLVSFFSDISSEMVYPLIPLYLTSVFGVTPGLVGIIEGIADDEVKRISGLDNKMLLLNEAILIEKAKIEVIKWKPRKDSATIQFAINRKYTNNLKLEFIP